MVPRPRRADVSDGLQQPPIVEPVDPFQRGVFDSFEGSPRASPVDQLSLVKTIDSFGQSIVIAVTDAANRRLDPGFGQALGVLDREILAAAIAVMD